MEFQDPTSKVQVAFVTTSNLHLATLLATVGCKPQQIVRGPERTPQGALKIKWVFESDAIADEVIALWNTVQTVKEWEAMDRGQRMDIINVVHAFAGNLKHFLSHTKEAR